MENSPGLDRELLDRLYAAFEEATSYDDRVLHESLTEEGIEPKDLIGRGLRLVHSLSRQQRLLVARAQLDRIRGVISSVAKSGEKITGDVRRALAEALAGEGEGRLAQTYFRKLESIEEEDLQSLIDDASILTMLERLHQQPNE